MTGYGKFAVVDLTTVQVTTHAVSLEEQQHFFGGGGIAAKLFIDEGDNDAIVIANGLLTGFTAPTACKTSFIFISPLTGIIGESSVGGKWGAQLKRTGLDGLLIKGRSEKPVYLFVGDDGVEIRDASAYWGLSTFAAHDKLAAELPDGAKIGVIGPGGENGVRYAAMMFEGENARAAGRTGIGAKFGEKKIKALAVHGTQKPEPHDADGLKQYVRDLNRSVRERTKGLHKFGTAGAVLRREQSGDLPIKNFAQGLWDGAAKITGQVYIEKMHAGHHACFMCPIACAKKIKINEGEHRGLVTSQPEYETVGALGSNLLLDSPEDVAYANRLCNELGVDTISAGVVIGFLFECVEKQIVDEKDVGLDDCRPVWGDGRAIAQLIEKIARREGIGDVLADGVRAAAERFGQGSADFAVHAKGLELPMHDPRGLVSSAATYATGNRGGSHNESPAYYLEEGMKIDGFPQNVDPHTPVGKGAMTAQMQDLSAAFDALGLCKFLLAGGIGAEQMCRLTNLIFGWSLTTDELLRVGDRIFTLKRIFNLQRGMSAMDDTLSPRILREKRGTGGAAEVLPDLETMRADLYTARGWDEQGRVTHEKAASLDLGEYLD